MQVIVDGLLTNYLRTGKGKVLVIVPGWGDSSKSWLSVAQGLAEHYEVIVLDLPGFGGTQRPSGAWGLVEYADFIAKFLEKLQVKQVYAYIGHSNGGAIAIHGLATGRLRADKLVLLASAGIRGTYKGRLKAVRYLTKVGKALTTPLPKSAKKHLRQTVYQTVGSDMLVAEHMQETFKKIVTDDVRADASKLTQPTLLVYGEQDDQAPVSYGKLFHELIDGSTLEILPSVGHFLQVDRPHEVVQLVQEFLA